MSTYPVATAESAPDASTCYDLLLAYQDDDTLPYVASTKSKVASSSTQKPYTAITIERIEHLGTLGIYNRRAKRFTAGTAKEFVRAVRPITTESSNFLEAQPSWAAELDILEEHELVDEQLPPAISNHIALSLVVDAERTCKKLLTFLSGHRVGAMKALAICQAAGRVSNRAAIIHVLNMLTSLLSHSTPAVRDAAIVGLALADDPRALPALRIAYERESSQMLRETIAEVIAQF